MYEFRRSSSHRRRPSLPKMLASLCVTVPVQNLSALLLSMATRKPHHAGLIWRLIDVWTSAAVCLEPVTAAGSETRRWRSLSWMTLDWITSGPPTVIAPVLKVIVCVDIKIILFFICSVVEHELCFVFCFFYVKYWTHMIFSGPQEYYSACGYSFTW